MLLAALWRADAAIGTHGEVEWPGGCGRARVGGDDGSGVAHAPHDTHNPICFGIAAAALVS